MIQRGQQDNEADLRDEADKAKDNDTDKAKAYEVNKAIVANAANKAYVINVIIAANIKHSKKLVLDDGIAFDDLLLYSLTKCSVIFAKMKEYFGITISNFLN
jgi:hypothetical protein